MKKLIVGLLLLPGLAIKGEEIIVNPNCALEELTKLKDKKFVEALFEKEKSNIDEGLFYYWAEIYQKVILKASDLNRQLNNEKDRWYTLSISTIAPLAKELDKIKEEEIRIMAQFYEEKRNKFSNYSVEEQSLLIAEAEVRLSTFLNNNNVREEISEAVHKARGSEGKDKMSQEKMLKPLVDFINCMNKASQDNTVEHAKQCVKMHIKNEFTR